MTLDLKIHPSFMNNTYKDHKVGFKGKNTYQPEELTKTVITELTQMLELPYGMSDKEETLKRLGTIEPAPIPLKEVIPMVQYKTATITREEFNQVNSEAPGTLPYASYDEYKSKFVDGTFLYSGRKPHYFQVSVINMTELFKEMVLSIDLHASTVIGKMYQNYIDYDGTYINSVTEFTLQEYLAMLEAYPIGTAGLMSFQLMHPKDDSFLVGMVYTQEFIDEMQEQGYVFAKGAILSENISIKADPSYVPNVANLVSPFTYLTTELSFEEFRDIKDDLPIYLQKYSDYIEFFSKPVLEYELGSENSLRIPLKVAGDDVLNVYLSLDLETTDVIGNTVAGQPYTYAELLADINKTKSNLLTTDPAIIKDQVLKVGVVHNILFRNALEEAGYKINSSTTYERPVIKEGKPVSVYPDNSVTITVNSLRTVTEAEFNPTTRYPYSEYVLRTSDLNTLKFDKDQRYKYPYLFKIEIKCTEGMSSELRDLFDSTTIGIIDRYTNTMIYQLTPTQELNKVVEVIVELDPSQLGSTLDLDISSNLAILVDDARSKYDKVLNNPSLTLIPDKSYVYLDEPFKDVTFDLPLYDELDFDLEIYAVLQNQIKEGKPYLLHDGYYPNNYLIMRMGCSLDTTYALTNLNLDPEFNVGSLVISTESSNINYQQFSQFCLQPVGYEYTPVKIFHESGAVSGISYSPEFLEVLKQNNFILNSWSNTYVTKPTGKPVESAVVIDPVKILPSPISRVELGGTEEDYNNYLKTVSEDGSLIIQETAPTFRVYLSVRLAEIRRYLDFTIFGEKEIFCSIEGSSGHKQNYTLEGFKEITKRNTTAFPLDWPNPEGTSETLEIKLSARFENELRIQGITIEMPSNPCTINLTKIDNSLPHLIKFVTKEDVTEDMLYSFTHSSAFYEYIPEEEKENITLEDIFDPISEDGLTYTYDGEIPYCVIPFLVTVHPEIQAVIDTLEPTFTVGQIFDQDSGTVVDLKTEFLQSKTNGLSEFTFVGKTDDLPFLGIEYTKEFLDALKASGISLSKTPSTRNITVVPSGKPFKGAEETTFSYTIACGSDITEEEYEEYNPHTWDMPYETYISRMSTDGAINFEGEEARQGKYLVKLTSTSTLPSRVYVAPELTLEAPGIKYPEPFFDILEKNGESFGVIDYSFFPESGEAEFRYDHSEYISLFQKYRLYHKLINTNNFKFTISKDDAPKEFKPKIIVRYGSEVTKEEYLEATSTIKSRIPYEIYVDMFQSDGTYRTTDVLKYPLKNVPIFMEYKLTKRDERYWNHAKFSLRFNAVRSNGSYINNFRTIVDISEYIQGEDLTALTTEGTKYRSQLYFQTDERLLTYYDKDSSVVNEPNISPNFSLEAQPTLNNSIYMSDYETKLLSASEFIDGGYNKRLNYEAYVSFMSKPGTVSGVPLPVHVRAIVNKDMTGSLSSFLNRPIFEFSLPFEVRSTDVWKFSPTPPFVDTSMLLQGWLIVDFDRAPPIGFVDFGVDMNKNSHLKSLPESIIFYKRSEAA